MSEGEGDVTVGDWQGEAALLALKAEGGAAAKGCGQTPDLRDADRLPNLKKAGHRPSSGSFREELGPQHRDGTP